MRYSFLFALFALISQAQPTAPPVASDGVVEITVHDSVTKNPVPGARVTFNHYQTPPPNIVTYVNADENGHASFKNVVGGNYGISAQRDGYVNVPGAAAQA